VLPRRAKIVCTIGPACSQPAQLEALLRAGMDVARLNFSHGSHDDHRSVILDLRRLADEFALPLAILQDLQGPKIRLGSLADGSVTLATGASITITTRDVVGDAALVSTPFSSLPDDVKPGDQILLSDGLLRLEVTETTAQDVLCVVVDGGVLRGRAGMNLPGSNLSTPALTEKDRADLEFGIAEGVDFVALSFVRRAADVVELQHLISDRGATTPVIAKLEKPRRSNTWRRSCRWQMPS
jgi:pyruvate kinase